MKIEITEAEINFIQKIYDAYFFGMFQQMGIAKNEEEEYYYRDLLENLNKKVG